MKALNVQPPKEASSVINIFPNPVHDRLYFNVEKIDLPIEAIFYSTQGELQVKVVLENNENTIQLDHLSPGLYFLVMKTKDGQLFRKKMIKQ